MKVIILLNKVFIILFISYFKLIKEEKNNLNTAFIKP